MSTNDNLQRDAQITATLEAAFSAQINGRLKDLHTCLPGIIVNYDPSTQTATVQPAIQRVFTERGPVNLPVCVDVPVAFPGGGDFYLTFPVQAGDECVLLFSERAIDYWYLNGGTQLPAEYRLHDLSDGIAQVGLNSQARKLSGVQTDGAELRTRDRSTFIRLTSGTIYIKGNIVHDGDTTQTGDFTQTGDRIQAGSETVTGNMMRTGTDTATGVMMAAGFAGPAGAAATAIGGLSSTGDITTSADVQAGGKSLRNHTHPYTDNGAASVTGTPN